MKKRQKTRERERGREGEREREGEKEREKVMKNGFLPLLIGYNVAVTVRKIKYEPLHECRVLHILLTPFPLHSLSQSFSLSTPSLSLYATLTLSFSPSFNNLNVSTLLNLSSRHSSMVSMAACYQGGPGF